VRPAALSRLIEHVLRTREDIEILGRVFDASRLVPLATRHLPDVILANVGLLGREPAPFIAEIKRSSPASRVILVSRVEGIALSTGRFGADAQIQEQALVRSLLPLLVRIGKRAPKPRPAT
jgi:DNA-binding NarL/FixJ family response regulator